MLTYTSEVGFFTRVTGGQTGVVNIGASGGYAALLGILCGAGATAPMVQIWQGPTTAAATTIIGILTCALNSFTRIPAYCSGGATIYVSNAATPDLTIYWNPVSG